MPTITKDQKHVLNEPKLKPESFVVNLKEYFRTVIGNINIPTYTLKYFEETNKLKVRIPLIWIDKFVMVLYLEAKLNDNNDPTYTITALVCHNNFEPVALQSSNIVKLLNRYFLKVNSNFKYGYFAVNPDNGQICFKVNSNILTNWKYAMEKDNMKLVIRTQITTIAQALKFHLIKILLITNLISDDEYRKLEKAQEYSMRKVIPEWFTLLEKLVNKYFKTCIEDQVPEELKKNLIIVSNTQPTRVRTNIFITTTRKSGDYGQLIQEGGFSKIYADYLEFRIDENQNNLGTFQEIAGKLLTRYMVMKKEKILPQHKGKEDEEMKKTERYEKNRIENERRILDIIADKENMNIARYFQVIQNDFFPATDEDMKQIIMEFYPHKSLESFMTHHPHLSLNTKFWFLIQIANGIRFLTDNQIYHLDLKPGNVLLTRNFICKLIDFGESYYPGKDTSIRPGKTFPYAPPEVFKDNIDYTNTKMDAFSLGVIMCEMLFDQMIVDYKKSNLQGINQKFFKESYKIKLNSASCRYFGPKHFMKVFRYFMLFCTESNPTLRPGYQYLVALLKEGLNYLDRMY